MAHEANEDLLQQQDMINPSQPDLSPGPDMTPVPQCTPVGNLCDGASTCCDGVCGHIGPGVLYECCLPSSRACVDGNECCSKSCFGHVCV